MKLPNYEQQNKFIRDYVLPLLQGNLKGIAHNYKRNQREALRNDMQEAGVFDSLRRMDKRGTLEEQVFGEMRSNIAKAERAREYESMANEIYTLVRKDPHYVSMTSLLLSPKLTATLDAISTTQQASEMLKGITEALIHKDPMWYYKTFLKQDKPQHYLASGFELTERKI